ncbi:AraC family transcriptional regulator [Coprococcus sp. AF19-8AC]|uniref:helix-turn-helix domain-containing protein n=1 Tax=Coprococcus sp. AF19-8AC TaxID=2293090 RepID=UPI000E7250AA|nr:AraC family transcriptional regulator [Coprococcus sp. AF19-8AC]RJV47659.1 AraC family transcriptional regulator [Coprococcus sp. AF19-8AC]
MAKPHLKMASTTYRIAKRCDHTTEANLYSWSSMVKKGVCMDVRVQKLMEKSSYIRNVVGRIPTEMLSYFLDKIQFSVSDLEGEVVRLKMGENGQYMSFLSPMQGIEIMEYYMGGLDDIPGHSEAKALDNTMVIHYCNMGSAEINIDSGRYAYMRPGTLCIEWRQETGKKFNFYDELYGGIEISISMDSISSEDERFLRRAGIDMDTLRKAYERNDQYYIGQCHERLRHAFDDLRDIISSADKDRYSYLVNMLNVLDLIRTDDIDIFDKQFYLTKGQRRIAQEIHDMVRQDHIREITMNELEKMYDLSSVSINKYFEIMYGDTVKRYIQNQRMQKAAKLLKNSDTSIADIALAVGYESQSKFGVIFKRYCGCTPLEYRRRG